MPGQLILAGGDEFRPGCEEMDTAILRASGAEAPRVLILPTAAVTGPQKAANDGVRHFSGLGAQASQLMVLDRGHADDEEVVRAVSEASVVYFTGGDPDHLLATLQGSRLLEYLQAALSNGAIVGGSSAGAMVMGSMMKRPSSGQWVQGLGIAQAPAVLPHHERSDPDGVALDLSRTAPPGLKVLGIDARTCCLGTPGHWRVLGIGRVVAYQKGTWKAFTSGEGLPVGF